MYVLTAEEMRRVDAYAIETIGIPAAVLMENAGALIAREAEAFWLNYHHPKTAKPIRWAILIGKGNNGGDGLVAARHLAEMGHLPTLIYAVPPETLAGEAAMQRDVVIRLGLPYHLYGKDPIDWSFYDGIVDALLGTGTRGAPTASYSALIREANDSQLPIIAADIPSGLDPDTGMPHDPCIRACLTIALAFYKRGHILPSGEAVTGEVRLGSIGIWPSFAEQLGISTFFLDEKLFHRHFQLDPLLPRHQDTHKGTYGHVLVVAGSRQMTGAGLLSSKAALRTGCGLVSWAVPEPLVDALIGQLPEVMLSSVSGKTHSLQTADELLAQMKSRDAAVIGPGLGRFPDDCAWLRRLYQESSLPLVMDADGLNMLAEMEDFADWSKRQPPVVLTPHPGEMARLLRMTIAEVQQNRIELARDYARKHQLVLVLKGARTVVATPDGNVYINSTGNPGMATGGAGDVLAGVIASLMAQGLPANQAACLGVWLHGAAGDKAAARRASCRSLIASDIIEEL